MSEHANTKRSGTEQYRRKITLLGKVISENYPPLAIARAMRKNSKLGEMERKLDAASKSTI